jgi:cobalt-zinc-cadmium efflux system protein
MVVLAAVFSAWRFGPYLDPAASILVILLILRGSWGLLRDTTRILLEGTPAGLDLEALQRDIHARFPVRDLHHVHVWELSSGYRLLTAHVRLAEMPLHDAESLLKGMREHLAHEWSVDHATLEPEINGCVAEALIHSPSVQHKEHQHREH